MLKRSKILFYRLLYPSFQLYRRLFRPKTYGVRVVVWDKDTNKVLMVRHTYGNGTMWHLPGGAYNPRREVASESARRELVEETGLTASVMSTLLTYKTDAQGNDDTVEVFLYIINFGPHGQIPYARDAEVAEVAWFDVDDLLETPKVYRITRQSIRALKGTSP